MIVTFFLLKKHTSKKEDGAPLAQILYRVYNIISYSQFIKTPNELTPANMQPLL